MGLFDSLKRSLRSQEDIPTQPQLTVVTPTAEPSAPSPLIPTVLQPPSPAAAVRPRLLCVLTNPGERGALEALVAPLSDRWEILLAQGPDETWQKLEAKPFDALIIDRVTNQAEIEFTSTVSARYPAVQRFLCCGEEQRSLLSGVTGLHAIPAEADCETLCAYVQREFWLARWLSNDALKTLLGRMRAFPSMPTLYTQVISELQSPSGSLDFVARLIAKDPMMAAKMLQAVNSIAFGMARSVSDPMQAVLMMGAERTKSIVLLAKLYNQLDKNLCLGLSPEAMWQHSMATGAMAQSICLYEKKDTKFADTAFTAGLLHDVGRLLLAGNLSEEYSAVLGQAQARKLPVERIEQETLGTTHALVGAALMGSWGLPVPIIEAIAWHHAPAEAANKTFSLLTAVHAANVLAHEKAGGGETNIFDPMDAEYLDEMGLRNRRNLWRERCGVPPKVEDQPWVEKMGPGKAA